MTLLSKVETALIEEIARQVGATPIVYKTPTKNGELNLGSLARAAISAMGEPTSAMLKTIDHQKITDYGEDGAYLTEENIIWNWQVMLTAALSEKQ